MSRILTEAEEKRRLERLAEILDDKTLDALEQIITESKEDSAFRRRVIKISRILVWGIGGVTTFIVARDQLLDFLSWLKTASHGK